ncbi:N-acetyl-gamma-glutamyl-phosphate reductase [Lentibacillus halophilus]|uniref:N-acetyl-gamma-glutamyl-phosphate reductase n=1 Tax=Lentibacillus halophilus TaxID=295065 RepID=A0ABN0Z232_9BACI
MKAAIIGATGYGGSELIRLLYSHPNVTLQSFHSSSQHGQPVMASYPHMQGMIGDDLEDIDPERMAQDVDVVFIATPAGVSTELVPEFMKHDTKVIDVSGDFRLKDTDTYERWYHKTAPDQNYVNQAVYGLTEWLDTDIKGTQLLSNPGCYPTAALLGLAPLVKEKRIDPNSIIIDAKTGVSGAGRKVSAASHFTETNDNLKIYKVLEHQHTPEIEMMLDAWSETKTAITFSTHLIPMTRGIMTTIYADAPDGMTARELFDLYQESYKDTYFVRVRKQGEYPTTKDVYGSNFCDISLSYDERTNRIMIVSVIDNLVKGAAGQAVQNMNRMFGLEETAGLDTMPMYP